MTTHFAIWGWCGFAPACNFYAEYDDGDPSLVDAHEDVTCKRCKRTKVFARTLKAVPA